eukprot:Opistho-1_new@61460
MLVIEGHRFHRQTQSVKLRFYHRGIADDDIDQTVGAERLARRRVDFGRGHRFIGGGQRLVIIVGAAELDDLPDSAEHVARGFEAAGQFADAAVDRAFKLFLRHALVAEEAFEVALQLLDRIARAIGLHRRRGDPGEPVLVARNAAAHAIGPALGLAQIGVEARQEIAAENIVRRAQNLKIIAALGSEHLAREDHRLRRLRPVEQQDAWAWRRDRDLEMLDRFRGRGRLPLAERRIELLLHFGERRVADDEDARIVGTDPRRMKRRKLALRHRRHRFRVAQARRRDAIGMVGAVQHRRQNARSDRVRVVEFGLQPVELLRPNALEFLGVERRVADIVGEQAQRGAEVRFQREQAEHRFVGIGGSVDLRAQPLLRFGKGDRIEARRALVHQAEHQRLGAQCIVRIGGIARVEAHRDIDRRHRRAPRENDLDAVFQLGAFDRGKVERLPCTLR